MPRSPALKAITDCRRVIRLPDGSRMSASLKHTLITLATYYGGPDKEVFPSQATLARDMCVDRSTVKRRLKALEDAGLIVRIRGSQHRSTRYRLKLVTIRECCYPVEEGDKGLQ